MCPTIAVLKLLSWNKESWLRTGLERSSFVTRLIRAKNKFLALKHYLPFSWFLLQSPDSKHWAVYGCSLDPVYEQRSDPAYPIQKSLIENWLHYLSNKERFLPFFPIHLAAFHLCSQVPVRPILSGYLHPTSGNTLHTSDSQSVNLWATPAQEWLEKSQGHAKERILKSSPVAQEPSLRKPGPREAQQPWCVHMALLSLMYPANQLKIRLINYIMFTQEIGLSTP